MIASRHPWAGRSPHHRYVQINQAGVEPVDPDLHPGRCLDLTRLPAPDLVDPSTCAGGAGGQHLEVQALGGAGNQGPDVDGKPFAACVTAELRRNAPGT